MKLSVLVLLIAVSTNGQTLYDFNKNSDIKKWRVVDDVVMGGRSSGEFSLNDDGHGVFKGTVSLENYGGFSSVRYRFKKKDIQEYSKVVIRLKGDGKNYQFRLKANVRDYYSYIYTFSTNGKWQNVEIPLKKMYPSYRGRKLDRSNFNEGYLEEMAFLIANKKAEEFKLLLDKIEVK
jgi:NADH dehydrogenase [ubiquinone] 1 alpha subcomplex assembly factor 1